MKSLTLGLLAATLGLAALLPRPTAAGRAASATASPISVSVNPIPQGFDPFAVDGFGTAILCCDLDNNGDLEVVVGAPYAVPPGLSQPMGSIFIYDAGDPTPKSRIDVTDEPGSGFGTSLACCRRPGVGMLLFVGAPFATNEGQEDAGQVLAIRFEDGVPVLDRIFGGAAGENFGAEIACCDLNRDGSPEVLISSTDETAADPRPGHISIFTLSGQLLRILPGEAPGDGFGDELLCCDLNADGFDELVVGSESASPGGREGAGAVWVYQGRSAQGLRLRRRLNGPNAGDRFGQWLACEPPQFGFPRGRFQNLLVGAENARGTGTFSVFSGLNLNLGLGFTRGGQSRGEQFGSSLAPCRLTRGRVPVIVVGAQEFDNGAGRLYLFGDRGQFYRTLTPPGPFNPGALGDQVICCDWNGDGFEDILASATGNGENGAVFIFSGLDATLLATLNAAAG